MTAIKQPTIRFKQGRDRIGFTCTCGQRMGGFVYAALCRASAQEHADWHFDRDEHPTIELGGLL